MKRKELKNKVAVISGVGGIGQNVAKLFDKEGVKLALADKDITLIQNILGELKQDPLIVSCDITNLEQVRELYSKTLEKYGKIDFLVNTVGIILPGSLEKTSYEEIEKQININLMGTINCTKEIIPIMKKSGQGHIITISSLAGIIPETYSSIYTATKFALRGLDWTLYFELKDYNIKISTIFPDSVETPMLRYEAEHDGSPLTFLHDPVQPEEVAKAVLKAILKEKIEVCIPHTDGILSKLVMSMPSVLKWLWPRYEKKGEIKKQEYIKHLESNQN